MFKTEIERDLFSELLDVNWKIEQKEYNSLDEKVLLNIQFRKVHDKLLNEMGEERFLSFMKKGRLMFS